MMVILLIATGALFALLFIVNSFARTAQGREKVSFFETLLAFLAVILPLLALVNNNSGEQPLTLVNTAAIGIAVVVIIVSVIILVVEQGQSPRKFNQRRGIFGMGIGALLIGATFLVPVTSRLIAPPPFATGTFNATPDGIVSISAQPSAAMQILMEETGLDSGEINARLDAGETVASIIEDSGGDLERVVSGITDATRQQIETAAGSSPQASFLLSNLENIVSQGVNGQLPPPIGDRLLRSLLSGETFTPPEGGIPNVPAAIGGGTAPEGQVVLAPTNTSLVPLSATLTRLPSATPTPTNTPYLLVSPTPGEDTISMEEEVTAQILECWALVNWNLNLRTGPGPEYNRLLTIPYATTVSASGRNEESTWWFVTYETETGWVDGEYITLSGECAALPVTEGS